MAGKVVLLLWAQTLSLARAQTTQILVKPPWTPPFPWDWVTLTCQSSGSTGATTWYKDGQRWGQQGRTNVTVIMKGTYQCDRPGTGLSPPVIVSEDWLVLQVPAQALLEGDTVTLRCRGYWNSTVTSVSFYQEGKELGVFPDVTELSLSPLQLSHSGHYSCRGKVGSWGWRESPPVTVTVHGVPLSGVSLSAQPPGGQVALGDSLVLSCTGAVGTGPLSFSWYREGSGAPLGTGPCLELSQAGDNDSGQYRCRVSDGDSVAKSDPLNVTVLVPVANATITPGPLSHQVRAGDPVTLHCSVQVGSVPATFTWLHNGQEVARGPLLELSDIDVGHWGTYQCLATNQLGQDGHRVFRALSPELALEVTPGSPWGTAVAVNVSRTLLFLLLLLAVIGGCHCWHRWEWLVLQVPAWALQEGDTVTLRCWGWQKRTFTSVSFYHEEKELQVVPNWTELSLSPLQLNHRGSSCCKAWVKPWGWKESAPVTVTGHVPVANATITPSPLSRQVHAGENMTLHCSVQVVSAPVTFTWLHNRQEVAQGPLLELRDIDAGHWGTYQCMATNQLGQDRHRVFRALSPELALEVTPQDKGTHRDIAARKQQESRPHMPQHPPEEGEVLYTHVVVTKRAGASPHATTRQDPQLTNAELRGPQGRPREPGDIYGNVL
ncbi:Fc receptor-like protein 4 [Agelaius tricolor]|uniref:Fc receptor-like protein 4 n=1 Tax=Agelaius tricolor TaxID=9191 RepID=UPI0039F2081E